MDDHVRLLAASWNFINLITNLLTQGVPLEDVQHLAGHADPRTTRHYDRRRSQVNRSVVDLISV